MDIKDKQLKYEKALKYEIFIKEEYGFSKQGICDADCVFDIWWHVWYFSQRCKALNSKVKIHYFEPVGELYERAKINLWNEENIIFNNCWIGPKTEKWMIFLNQEKTMQSSKYHSFLNPNWTKIGVNFISLKDYLEQGNLDKIDVLKMDIEWMEFEVFDSRSNLEWWKIKNLIAEIHLIDEDKKLQRNLIFQKVKNIFWNVEIISSSYRDNIFLIRACKISK